MGVGGGGWRMEEGGADGYATLGEQPGPSSLERREKIYKIYVIGVKQV